MSDTNFAQAPGVPGQLGNEIFRLGLGEIFVERNYQEMADSKSANQRDLMRRGSDKMGWILWPQNFGRMWIERDNNRRSIFRMGMPRRSGDDGLVTEVHAVECADREEKRTVQLREIGGGMEDFHHAPRIRETCGNESTRATISDGSPFLI